MLYFVTIRHGHFQDTVWGCHLNGNSPSEVKATATALYERDQSELNARPGFTPKPPLAECTFNIRKSNAHPSNAMNA